MLLNMKNVCYKYLDSNNVIETVNLSIESHQIIAILGHNGAGKTTLLRLCAELLVPQTGTINRAPILQEKYSTTYVPDVGGYYPTITPKKNIDFFVTLSKRNSSNSRMSLELLDSFNLLEHANKNASDLSHGMKKRLALLCALAVNPKLILLDETLNGVDPESTDLIINKLMLEKCEGKTILVCTHDLSLAKRLCDSVIILQSGQVILDSPMSKLKEDLVEVYQNLTYGRREMIDVGNIS